MVDSANQTPQVDDDDISFVATAPGEHSKIETSAAFHRIWEEVFDCTSTGILMVLFMVICVCLSHNLRSKRGEVQNGLSVFQHQKTRRLGQGSTDVTSSMAGARMPL